jgi:malonyl-CoA O-methyltransferase
LPAREGYRRWAPHYEAETAVSSLEDEIVASLGVETAGCALLDVGCGTGRRLCESGAATAVGIDVAPEMLSYARGSLVTAGDIRALPFDDASFEVVWCRLVIGHVAHVTAAFGELSRVCSDGGVVVVSDLSPEAIAAGHRRTFRDENGEVHELEHFVHSLDGEAAGVGLSLESRLDGVVGPSIESFYVRAGRPEAYEEQKGLRLVRALAWRRDVRGATRAARQGAERGARATVQRDGVEA